MSPAVEDEDLSALPWFSRVLLVDATAVSNGLARLRASGAFAEVPNAWQVSVGVARMWHRVLFRSETIGLSSARVRATRRARLLRSRVLRFPFLLRERAIAPLDFSGLVSDRARILSHLLGAHHEGDQFVYDLELLRAHPGALEELERRAADVVSGRDPRAEFLRDLVVFEGYHEALLEAARRALAGDFSIEDGRAEDPDVSLRAYLAWCARQPASWEEARARLASGWLGALSTLAARARGAA